jgi:hypothetical protein
MMWLQPAALWLLALAAGPIAIHLLRTRRSKRVAFPSVRFVRPSQTASVRLHAPSDLLLLALRVAIVALAALACAQPLWITPAREAAWNARVARAIVIDASESMRDSAAAEAVRATVARESAAFTSRTFESADIGDGIRRAVAWFGHVPPARREVIVISDFQLGSMTGAKVGNVPASVGLRFERVTRSTVVTSPAVRRLAAPDSAAQTYAISVTDRGTAVELQAGQPDPTQGLRLLGGAGQEHLAAAVMRALAAAGTPAPDSARPIAVRTRGAITDAQVRPIADRWMIEVIAGLSRDAEINRLARSITEAVPQPEPWTVVVRGQSGQPVVRAAASGSELTLDVVTPLESYFTAALGRAALRHAPWARAPIETEPETIQAATLTELGREPGPAETASWRSVEHSDARWFWAAALLLLVVETWLRNRTAVVQGVQRAAA